MLSKLVFTSIFLLKTAVLAVSLFFQVVDWRKGISAGWAFNTLFFLYLGLPLLAVLAYFETKALGATSPSLKYLPVLGWALCFVGTIYPSNRYYFEVNIVALSLALALTWYAGAAFSRANGMG